MIEIGPLVPAGTDSALGKRIKFADKYYFGSLSMARNEMIEPYATLYWVRLDQAPGDSFPIVYADGVFAAYDRAMSGGRIFGLHFPKRYLKFTDEDTRRSIPSSSPK
jgi:hypothetical protein